MSSTTVNSPNAHTPRSAIGNLDVLHPEIRLMIYCEVFRGAELNVRTAQLHLISRENPFSPYRLVNETALIRTCRQLRDEAHPILKAAIKLVIGSRPYSDRSDPLANFPNDFLAKVQNLTVQIDAFVHISRQRLPSLKQVQLFVEVPYFSTLGHIAESWISRKETARMSWLTEKMMQDVYSWRWKLQQFALLGEWEGFQVAMTGVWHCPMNAGVGVSFDCHDATATKATAFIEDFKTSLDNTVQIKKHWKVRYGPVEEGHVYF